MFQKNSSCLFAVVFLYIYIYNSMWSKHKVVVVVVVDSFSF